MKERYFSTFQLILMAMFAALVVVAKIALRAAAASCPVTPGCSGWRSWWFLRE